MSYDWKAGLALFIAVIALRVIGRKLAFLVPELAQAREINLAEDRLRLAKDKYPPIVRQNNRIGLATNLAFFIGMAPFCVVLTAQPWWRAALDFVAILMAYDFLYYLTHRFVFHGPLLLKVHGLHHQARDPCHIDAFYVHPLETLIGIALFMGTIVGLVPLLGPFHVAPVALAFWVFTEINTINHTRVDLPRFPWRTLTWITRKHHVHHENMQMGNYATITLLYDSLFGTLD